jgi:hypothetical protein
MWRGEVKATVELVDLRRSNVNNAIEGRRQGTRIGPLPLINGAKDKRERERASGELDVKNVKLPSTVL